MYKYSFKGNHVGFIGGYLKESPFLDKADISEAIIFIYFENIFPGFFFSQQKR